MRGNKTRLLEIVATLGNTLPATSPVPLRALLDLTDLMNSMSAGRVDEKETAFRFVEWCERELAGVPLVLEKTKADVLAVIAGRKRDPGRTA